MSNSKLFTDAHKMTKLTIQPNETYRYKFGKWLIFLKTGITNVLGFTNVNQSVCYVPRVTDAPLLKHDTEYHYTIVDNNLFNILKFICTNPLSLFIIFMITMFIVLL